MNIGIVLSKTPGYSETFFISKIKGLQTNGHSVILFTQSTSKGFNLCRVKPAFPIFKRNHVKQLLWFVRVFIELLFHPKQVLKFITLEKEQNSSLVSIFKKVYSSAHILTQKLDWLHFGFATMALGKENVAKSIGAKLAVSLRGFDIAIYPIKQPNCYKLLWKKIDKVHVISNDLYSLAIKNGLSEDISIQKITPAVDIEKFNVSSSKSTRSIQNKFITVARLHWKKGLIDTLKAFKLLKDQGFDFKYTIVGEGRQYEALTYIIHALDLSQYVVLIGRKSHSEVKALLVKHEYYIQYSVSEGFCNAVLEAQAMGLLCIVSDAEGLPENVLDNKSGWVVEKCNPKRLAKKILKVSNLSLEAKDNIRRFAINRVQNEFNLGKQQQEFIKFYNSDL